MKRFSFVFVFSFIVSLSIGLTKIVAQDSVEISSPEESVEKALPSFGLIPRQSRSPYQIAGPFDLGVLDEPLDDAPEIKGEMMANPLLVNGLFPVKVKTYKVDPLSTFLAAAITLSIQSLRETGHVDPDAIIRLLDSTDLWAGIIGTGVGAYTKEGIDIGVQKVFSGLSPHTVASLSNQTALRFLGEFINGVTYTFAVSSGFEYFSQFWKLCTEGVENVSRVSDIVHAERKDINPVIENLKTYFFDAGMQKRILASIRDNRIMTFEFMATNLALFAGVFIGDQIAKRIGPEVPNGFRQVWAKRLKQYFARILGGVVAGVVVEFIPDGVRVSVNKRILNWQIARKMRSLDARLADLQYGLAHELYPIKDPSELLGIVAPDFNLLSDLDRVSRMLDSLNSMYMKQFFILGKDQEAFAGVTSSFSGVESELGSLITGLGGDDWMTENIDRLNPVEIGNLAEKTVGLSETDKYYIQVLSAERDRMKRDREKLNIFINQILKFRTEFRGSEFGSVQIVDQAD